MKVRGCSDQGPAFTKIDFEHGLILTNSQILDRRLNSSVAQSCQVLDCFKLDSFAINSG